MGKLFRTVQRKILGVIVILVVGLGAVAWFSGLTNYGLATQALSLKNVSLAGIGAIYELREQFATLDALVNRVASQLDTEKMKTDLETFKATADALEGKLNDFAAKNTDAEIGAALKAIGETLPVYRTSGEKVFKNASLFMQQEAATALQSEVFPAQDKISASLKQVMQRALAQTAQEPDRLAQQAQAGAKMVTSVAAVFIVVGVLLCLLIVQRYVSRPLRRTTDMVRDIAEGDGDLTKRLQVVSSDEIGEMAGCFNTFVEKIQGIVADITANMETLAASSTELSTVSAEMLSSTKSSSEKTGLVVAAAGEMSAHATSMAMNMESSASNLTMVATATEEMTATIGEIANNSEKARAVTGDAARRAEQVQALMDELGTAAQEIGKVTEAITSVASQTNLLALNATIEAARAGAAGKGFAVVAGEIKELAQQVASATEDIRKRISGIQRTTRNAIADVGDITNVIREVNEVVTTIATAIEEQSVVTRDIAANIAQASSGVNNANELVGQASSVARMMVTEADETNALVNTMSNGSEQVSSSALDLSRLAEQLNSIVRRFKI